MTKGESRNRSGPSVDPRSGRSDPRGVKFKALPSEGYTGDVPAFDLPDATDREHEVWAELWSTPQAAAWAAEPWRIRTVAMYCRWSVRSEGDVAAGFLGQVHRLGDQIGLTPAGLRENRWAIAADEVTEKRTEKMTAPEGKAAPAVTGPRPLVAASSTWEPVRRFFSPSKPLGSTATSPLKKCSWNL